MTVAPLLLDLHEGITDPRAGGCGRWPEGLHLLAVEPGQAFVGRCKATNLCSYCQRLYVLETVEMLLLDAAEWPPSLWVVLTAREHLSRKECSVHLGRLRDAAKRRWPDIEWFVQVEFQRRGALHANLLVKGVSVDDREALHSLLARRWCARVDAEPVGQWSGEVADAGGLARYLAKNLAHGLKREQAPPLGWRGHRTSQTRGYLVRPAAVMREEARASRQRSRALTRAVAAGHAAGIDADAVADAELAEMAEWTWRLWRTPRAGQPLASSERDSPAGVARYMRPEARALIRAARARAVALDRNPV